jgi:4-hydroxyphenylacetate 3-monooxygenase
VKDAYMHVVHESDAGLVISGAKGIATTSSLTHYTLVVCHGPVKSPDFSFVCLVPTGSRGVKLICRTSYEMTATACGRPLDYPLSSRMDENDSILVFDRVLVPWENVLAHGVDGPTDVEYQESGFQPSARLHACTRLAVKLDFFCGLLMKAADATGRSRMRDVRVQLGEVLAWRHLFWALSDAMVHCPVPWANGHVLPNPDYALSFRVMANAYYPKIREVGHDILAHAGALANVEWPGAGERCLGGSQGDAARPRRQVLALLWDAIGSEFATRHELFERTHLGSYDGVRLEVLKAADAAGISPRFKTTVEQCLAEYEGEGWTVADFVGPTK